MAKVGQIFVSLGLDTASFTSNLKKASDMAFGSSTEIRRSLEMIGKATAGMAVTAAISFGALIKREIDVADHFNDLSKRTGVAVETLSALKFAAEQSGTNMDALAVGLGKFNKAIFEASQGSKEQAAAFRNLGIQITDSSGKLRGTEEILLKVASRFAAIPDGAMKGFLAIQLFGKAGGELIPLLNEGAQGLQKFMEKAREMGLVISGQTAAAADQLNDNLNELKGTLTGFTRQLAGPVISVLANFKDGMRAINMEGGFAEGGEALFAQLKGAERFAEAMRAQGNKKISVLTIEDQWAVRNIAAAAKLVTAQEAAKKAAEKLHAEMLAAAKNIKMVDFLPPSLLTLTEKTEGALAAIRQLGTIQTAMPDLGKELRDFGAEGRIVFESTRLPVERLAETMRHLNELVSSGAIDMDTFRRATQQAKEQSGLMADATGRIADANRQMASIFVSNIGDMIVGSRSLTEALGGIAQALQRMMLQIVLLEPLERFLRGVFGALRIGGGVSPINIGAFTGASAIIPQFAGGGSFGPRQMLMVGERGPELLFTGNHSGTIVPNGQAAGRSVVINNNFDNRGADFGTMAKTAALIAQLINTRTLERMADRASRTV